MPDYTTIIDAETWDFIHKTEKWYGPDAHLQTVPEMRRNYDAMCRAFHRGYPTGVVARDEHIQGVPLRVYERQGKSNAATVLYCHGGAFTLGGLDSHDDICAEICDATGFTTVSVDYRLQPEFTRAQAIEDVQKALNWSRDTLEGGVICVGDSAGGYLMAHTVANNRNQADIMGQVLIYPGLFNRVSGGSRDQHAHAPLLCLDEITEYCQDLGSGLQLDTDFSGLPITVALSAQCDPLADDARDYVDAINQAGGNAIWINERGLVHGYLRARHSVERAKNSFDRILKAISLIGAGKPFTNAELSTPAV